jgi:hypothetical protein
MPVLEMLYRKPHADYSVSYEKIQKATHREEEAENRSTLE